MSEVFNLKVHTIDAKTKRIKHVNPYRLHVVDGAHIFERPPGSGKFFDGQNQPIENALELIAEHAAPVRAAKSKIKIKVEGK